VAITTSALTDKDYMPIFMRVKFPNPVPLGRTGPGVEIREKQNQ
jgi:hypothetical protein